MQEKSKTDKYKSNLQEIINKHTDEQIREILKKRTYYQPEAVEIAVQEAIDRELIHSEQDLFSPEFSADPLKPKLIPEIQREKNRNRIRKSLGRSLLIAGVLPLILGFIQYNNNRMIEGGALLVFGLGWMFLSARIIRKGSAKTVGVMLLSAVLSLFYVVYLFAESKSAIFMDVFIAATIYFLLFYGLFFIRKLVD